MKKQSNETIANPLNARAFFHKKYPNRKAIINRTGSGPVKLWNSLPIAKIPAQIIVNGITKDNSAGIVDRLFSLEAL